MNKTDVYQSVTDRIIEALERDVAPWKKPWKTVGGYPVNVRNGRPYRGINVLLLMIEGYDDPRWGTFKAMRDTAIAEAKHQGREIIIEQAYDPKTKRMKEKVWEIVGRFSPASVRSRASDGERVWFSGGIKKGEKSTQIVLWKPVTAKKDSSGETVRDGYIFLTSYNVFNAKQAEGIPALPEEEKREFTPIEAAQQIVDNYAFEVGSGNAGPPVLHGRDKAAYSPSRDEVYMPDPELFVSDQAYYSTLFHELTHSTGHEKRLKRIETALFGTDPYAKEELVAEIGASFLAGAAGFDDAGGDQSAAYLKGWLEPLRNDKKFVVQAAAQAQKATDLILGTTFEEKEEEHEERQLETVA